MPAHKGCGRVHHRPLPPKAAAELKGLCGVFEHGLFCGMTTSVIIAGKDGISQKP